MLRTFAPAKINLLLHVGPPRADGLHPLESLVAFADVGDWLRAAPADDLQLTLDGPFAPALAAEADNLVLRAARLLAEAAGKPARAHLHLEKHLPIASGIGGGSADAAAALRALNVLWSCAASDADLEDLAGKLGSDVPACIRSRSALMRGTGLEIEPVTLAPIRALLVNPLEPAPTGAVYRAYDAAGAIAPLQPLVAPPSAIESWLAAQRNDLERAAIAVAPAIGETLGYLRALAPDALVRMSGSGATCFVLTDDPAGLALEVRRGQPSWWCAPAQLGAVDVSVAHG
jgi:4-diphosphocytidyl-2-C-methyl-D-erythritol kinase